MKKIIISLLSVMIIISTASSAFAFDADNFEDYSFPAMTGTFTEASGISNEWTMQVPKIEINTENKNGTSLLKSDGYVNADITVIDTDGSAISDSIVFKVRGNSTALNGIPKKAFTFKFEKGVDVLGMGKGKKWALLANCFDPTLLRNYTIFSLAQEMGLPYTSQQRITELWLDGDYRGCYTLYEPIQAGATRVDINTKANGGKKDFMLEIETLREEDDVTYIKAGGIRFAVSEPDEPEDEQVQYITDVMNGIINTLKTGSEDDIRSMIDIDSFAKFYLLNEYAKTLDFGFSSVFFFYKNNRLYAGPPWDYDLSLGNSNNEINTARTKNASYSTGIMQKDYHLYKYLCSRDWFIQEIKRVYAENYDYIDNISEDGGMLDDLREEYSDLFNRNFSKYKVNYWYINYMKIPLSSYDENYQFLKEWCTDRNSWLTEYYGLYRYRYIKGDADENEIIDISDATVIQSFLSQTDIETDDHFILRASVSGNEPDIKDATLIQQYTAKMDVPYPVGDTIDTVLY